MCLEQIWDPFFGFVAAAAAAAARPAVRRSPLAVSVIREVVTQTDSCECHNTNTKYACDAAHFVCCVSAYVCLRASQLPPDGRACDPCGGVGERVDDFVVIRRGAYSLGHDKKIPKYC
jgi:hypothetical protein